VVRDKVEEEEWKHLDVNEHWHKLKKIMMETAQHIYSTQLNEHLWTQVLKHLNVHIYLVTISYRY